MLQKEGRFYSGSRFEGMASQSIMVGTAWRQEGEAGGHITSTVGKQRDESCSTWFLLSLQSRSPTHGMVPPGFMVTLSVSVNSMGTLHWCAQRFVVRIHVIRWKYKDHSGICVSFHVGIWINVQSRKDSKDYKCFHSGLVWATRMFCRSVSKGLFTDASSLTRKTMQKRRQRPPKHTWQTPPSTCELNFLY